MFTNSPTCLADGNSSGWAVLAAVLSVVLGAPAAHAAGSSPAAAKARPRAVSEGFGWAFSDAFPRHSHQIGTLPEMNRVRLQPVSPLRCRAPPRQRWLNLPLAERPWL